MSSPRDYTDDRPDDCQLTSSMVAYMVERHDAIAALANGHEVDWEVMAEAFRATGLLDEEGMPPTAEMARETWYRLEERRQMSRTRQ